MKCNQIGKLYKSYIFEGTSFQKITNFILHHQYNFEDIYILETN